MLTGLRHELNPFDSLMEKCISLMAESNDVLYFFLNALNAILSMTRASLYELGDGWDPSEMKL